MLQTVHIQNFITKSGKEYSFPLSYQCFGLPLHSAPVVLVNHALTGNSDVAGERGWWKDMVGEGKAVDLNQYSVLAFNIPGNGFDGYFVDFYEDFVANDIAKIFLSGLEKLGITRLHSVIGGSLGGAIGWEMLAIQPDLAENLVPIATDFQTSDWLHSQCLVQEFLLNQTENPIEKARIHAMLCYRTPQSINKRFGKAIDENKGVLKSQDWLNYHGEALNKRFTLSAYRLMNQLLKTIETPFHILKNINANLHLVAVDSDIFFPAYEIKNCFDILKKDKENVYYHEISSIHGHDAFLMEYEQLERILKKIY
ncbi:MAG: alpha/beta fold hydrolase [Cloacibacterium sp.]|nr:alpha/beta fold hydrolase [Cloacibacterium sp.]